LQHELEELPAKLQRTGGDRMGNSATGKRLFRAQRQLC
jgi:hypothetical protein